LEHTANILLREKNAKRCSIVTDCLTFGHNRTDLRLVTRSDSSRVGNCRRLDWEIAKLVDSVLNHASTHTLSLILIPMLLANKS